MEVKVPQLPESVTDATLVAWHRKVGDAVSRDENLVDLETDKVVLEVPAPANGVIRQILLEDGATVTSGEILAVIEPGGAGAEPAPVEIDSYGKKMLEELGDGIKNEKVIEMLQEEQADRERRAK